jgi:hypothetical protein
MFEISNLRPKTTNLPFVVWVSRKVGARGNARVKVAHSAKVIPSHMGVYAVRPFTHIEGPVTHIEGPGLSSGDEKLLEVWLTKNVDTLIDFWDGNIEYTEDLIEKIRPL